MESNIRYDWQHLPPEIVERIVKLSIDPMRALLTEYRNSVIEESKKIVLENMYTGTYYGERDRFIVLSGRRALFCLPEEIIGILKKLKV